MDLDGGAFDDLDDEWTFEACVDAAGANAGCVIFQEWLNDDQTKNLSGGSVEAATCVCATDCAAAVGDLALDPAAEWQVAEAAVYGDTAGSARQHKRSQHLGDYATALAAWQAGHGDGISYILAEADPYAAIDLDHCRDLATHSIDRWAQNFLEAGRNSYSEVTPSGTGVRIWGLATGAKVNRKFTLTDNGKDIAAELFRHTSKVLTITGYKLDTHPKLRQHRSRD